MLTRYTHRGKLCLYPHGYIRERIILLKFFTDEDKRTVLFRWATWIVIIALLSAIATWFVTGEIIRSVTILVVFYPCALVLATPTAIMAGIGNATRYGILIREGDALERLAKIKRIAFDKTGTLTYGKPVVTQIISIDPKVGEALLLELAGINNIKAGCLPENKLEAIQVYQQKNEPVCMVGDGINDAPALKTAYVGIAMGSIGSDIAVDAADIVLVGDDIKEIPHLLQLAKKTMQTININLAASMALNFIAIGLAITGVLNPVVGALVHNIGSVAVIINSSLLLKWRNEK
ncbi:MAG TPA: cation-translocating P-type ATPase [Clostridiales bacterium]|nr:cation-translocating P-type ATPase [Clostridiales bacterium]